jgi:hypothetical protein
MLSSISQTVHLPSIGLSTTQTSLLVFPAPITYIDKGLEGLLAAKATNDLRVLLVKAGQEKFPSTSLHVLTEDGSVYAFPVFYEPEPVQSFFRLNSLPATASAGELPDNLFTGKKRGRTSGVSLQISGVQVHGEQLYCRILLSNTSDKGFSVEDIIVFIKERQRKTPAAIQEFPLCPDLIAGSPYISPRSKQSIILALPGYTIRKGQSLYIRVTEKEGDRHLVVKLDHSTIRQAKPIQLD